MADDTEARAWEQLTAQDLMQTKLLTVSVTTPLPEVERLLGEHRIGGVPVADEAGHLIGVVSVRDLSEHNAEDPDARSSDTAGDVMTGEVYSVDAGASLRDVAAEMVRLHVHRILVTRDTRHVGMITTFDVLEGIAGIETSSKPSVHS